MASRRLSCRPVQTRALAASGARVFRGPGQVVSVELADGLGDLGGGAGRHGDLVTRQGARDLGRTLGLRGGHDHPPPDRSPLAHSCLRLVTPSPFTARLP